MKINVRFQTATYNNKREMKNHKLTMLADGWKIDWENKLVICWKKSERIDDEIVIE